MPQDQEQAAASMIQRAYRGYRARTEVASLRLARDARWDDMIRRGGEQRYARQQLENENDVGTRWQRAVHAASRLQTARGTVEADDDGVSVASSVRKRRRATLWGSLSAGLGVDGKERDETEELPYTSKALEQQHWLEMIDPKKRKHRYGSNMKYYFRKWKEAETDDNFFRWLDRGDGKNLDLEELPRERLEREKILYLSAEQRLNYLVRIDKTDGRLRWARNGDLVDTRANRWRDAGGGRGIVAVDAVDPAQEGDEGGKVDVTVREKGSERGTGADEGGVGVGVDEDGDSGYDSPSLSSSSSSSGYSADSSTLQENESTHYVGLDEKDKLNWLQRKKKGITPKGIQQELLRKTLRRNTWIYVADMNLNLFIGIKQSGAFQHSSFLAGGKVSSAGLIVVKDGLIKSLTPLSGHYRSTIQHFRVFIDRLESRGADLSHVKVGKSVVTMWGLSKYAALTKGNKELASKFKRAVGLKQPEPNEG